MGKRENGNAEAVDYSLWGVGGQAISDMPIEPLVHGCHVPVCPDHSLPSLSPGPGGDHGPVLHEAYGSAPPPTPGIVARWGLVGIRTKPPPRDCSPLGGAAGQVPDQPSPYRVCGPFWGGSGSGPAPPPGLDLIDAEVVRRDVHGAEGVPKE